MWQGAADEKGTRLGWAAARLIGSSSLPRTSVPLPDRPTTCPFAPTHLQPNLDQLRKYTYGKHIVNKASLFVWWWWGGVW